MGPALRRRLPQLALAAAALLAHGAGLAGGFVWDDQMIITENPATRDLSQLGRVLLSADQWAPYYRPLNRASYLLDYQLWGMRPLGFHAVNLALLLACVLALHALARRLLPGAAGPLVAALLFAVHPLSVEAVAFVSARNNLFAILFALLSLAWFLDAAREERMPRAWLSGAALLLGLLSKEPALMVLPVLATCLVLPGLRAAPPALRSLHLLAPHAAAVALWLGLRAISLAGAPGAAGPAGGQPGLLQRLAINYQTLPAYLRLLVWPDELTIFHELPAPGAAWLPWAWLATATALALALCRRKPPILLGLAWFAASLLPIANLVPLPTTTPLAERYILFATVGLFLALGGALDLLWQRGRSRPWLAAVVALAALALGARTVARTLDWRDDVSLAQSALRVDPASIIARFNLGVALQEAGDLPGARAAWEEVLRREPGHAGAELQLGTAAAVGGDLGTAERRFRAALQADPALPEAWLNLGRLCERTGRPGEALPAYLRFLELAERADSEQARFAAARVQALRARRTR